MLQENYFLQNEILSMNLPLHAYIFAAVSFLKENTFLLKCFHYLSQSLKLQSISERIGAEKIIYKIQKRIFV